MLIPRYSNRSPVQVQLLKLKKRVEKITHGNYECVAFMAIMNVLQMLLGGSNVKKLVF